MFLTFLEYISQKLSKDSAQGTNDLKSDDLTIDFTGEDSKNKPPKKQTKLSGFNPEKMYGRRKKNELP